MSKNGNLKYQVQQNLQSKLAIGQSKHADKQKMKEEVDGSIFGISTGKIYSWSTYRTYLDACIKFTEYCERVHGVSKRVSLDNLDKYAEMYLKTHIEANKSTYTVKMQRSALSMMFGKKIEIEMPARSVSEIKRSRNEVQADKHFARDGKYKDVFDIASSCGCRREGLLNLKGGDMRVVNGHIYIRLQEKAGKVRLAPVLPGREKLVKEFFAKFKNGERCFEKVDKNIDIHSYRREYAQNLHECIKKNRELRDEILKIYPARKECVNSENYKTRDGYTFNRDDVYLITQALGHNRLEVTVTHYLK